MYKRLSEVKNKEVDRKLVDTRVKNNNRTYNSIESKRWNPLARNEHTCIAQLKNTSEYLPKKDNTTMHHIIPDKMWKGLIKKAREKGKIADFFEVFKEAVLAHFKEIFKGDLDRECFMDFVRGNRGVTQEVIKGGEGDLRKAEGFIAEYKRLFGTEDITELKWNEEGENLKEKGEFIEEMLVWQPNNLVIGPMNTIRKEADPGDKLDWKALEFQLEKINDEGILDIHEINSTGLNAVSENLNHQNHIKLVYRLNQLIQDYINGKIGDKDKIELIKCLKLNIERAPLTDATDKSWQEGGVPKASLIQ